MRGQERLYEEHNRVESRNLSFGRMRLEDKIAPAKLNFPRTGQLKQSSSVL